MKLNCRDIKDQLTAFADGELDSSQSQAMQAHLDECSECSQEVKEHHALKAKLKKTFHLPADAVDLDSVWENIESQLQFKPPFLQRFREMCAKPVVWMPSAVATAAIALLVFFVIQPQKQDSPMVSQVESVAVNSSSDQVWVLQTANSGQPLIWIQTTTENDKEAG